MTVPVSTYRVQLHKGFTFDDVANLADYLRNLGITHLYLSPVMKSIPGSMHGYDVVDFSDVSEERGGIDGLHRLMRALERMENPLQVILDIVPNHMAAHPLNPCWHDVLRRGAASMYWRYFDFTVAAGEKIRLPVLGKDLPDALEAGDVRRVMQGGRAALKCHGIIFPLNDAAQKVTDTAQALALQHYTLVKWSDIKAHMSYRRFFHITGLVSLRAEDDAVFADTHHETFRLLQEMPLITGLRVDHIDGLADPMDYLQKISRIMPAVWVEKILAHDETLPQDWPVLGTTGYEHIDRINRLMTDPAGFQAIEKHWRETAQAPWKNFRDCVTEAKRQSLDDLFPTECLALARMKQPDNEAQALDLIKETAAALQVYRTYERGDPFKTRWQQLTGPAMAKGMEDCAHYRYTPLASWNEVGCEPVVDSGGVAAYIAWMRHRLETKPASLNASTTHDTKRAEDARCRLYALADDPAAWFSFLHDMADVYAHVPFTLRHFYYQALAASWPLDGVIDAPYADRLWQYMQKSARENGIRTCWSAPDENFENVLENMVRGTLSNMSFIARMEKFHARIARAGAINSLAALMLKIFCPGIPDIYRGTETWDFSLVDPDNRRPVDYGTLVPLLDTIKDVPALLRDWRDGGIKIWMTQLLLQLRAKYFAAPDDITGITPVEVRGPMARHVAAYILESACTDVLVAVPLQPTALLGEGIRLCTKMLSDTFLFLPKKQAEKLGVCAISGKTLEIGDTIDISHLFDLCPVAIIAFNSLK
jgi:(1->4)-alpha-D-glucan 1-alpha-D-glucosylmutase